MSRAGTASSRNFSTLDVKSAFFVFVLLLIVGIGYWFVLPHIQSCFIPSFRNGRDGPWLIRPIFAFRAGAMAVMTCLTVPIILTPIRKVWAREDIALGSQYTAFRGRPVKRAVFYVQGFLLLLVYAFAFAFYSFSWTTIDANGIDQRLPWATLHHEFKEIEKLKTIPDGQRSDSLAQNGPWYSINLRSGRVITLSLDNEGINRTELQSIAAFVAEKSGLAWKSRGDSRLR